MRPKGEREGSRAIILRLNVRWHPCCYFGTMSKFERGSAEMSAFNVHVANVEKRLKHWGAELDKVANSALSIEVPEKVAFECRFVDLQAKLDFARSKLEALRGAGVHKWEAFKDDLELSIRHLETSFKE
jgi:hypothetical protein